MMTFTYHCNLHVLVYIPSESELLVTFSLRYTRNMFNIKCGGASTGEAEEKREGER